jgi:hypothetical protein
MALGTLCGGWRIVRTVGSRITHLTPMQGFCAETGGALALFGATWFGIPVSTTHTVTGSVVGVGAARRVSAVRWGVTRGILVAWIVTLPASAAVATGCYWLTSLFVRQARGGAGYDQCCVIPVSLSPAAALWAHEAAAWTIFRLAPRAGERRR